MLYCSTELVKPFYRTLFCFVLQYGVIEVGLENGTTKNVSGRRYQCLCQNKQGGLGEAREHSPNNGLQSSRSTEKNCPGGYTTGANPIVGDTPSGKIIQRLDQLESTHYKYVHAHQTRLRARLDESEKLEEQFRQEAAELRQQILDLATSEESADGNGHQS
jgi:hypothetical protein